MIIQIVLSLSIFIITIWWIRNRKLPQISALSKIILILILMSGFFIIFNPDIATLIANRVGVGRGSDLLIYINTILIFYLILTLSLGFRDLRNDIAKIVREIAMNQGFRDKHKKDE